MACILVVDDATDFLKILSFRLTKAGHEVHTANNGGDGLTAAGVVRPDLILIDMMMPEMDGVQVVTRLRAQGFVMPVVMMTALSDPANEARAREAGVQEFLGKPVRPQTLLDTVERLLAAR